MEEEREEESHVSKLQNDDKSSNATFAVGEKVEAD